MTRDPYYPPADRNAQSYSGKYPGSAMGLTAPVVVLHTTEGYGWPAYGGGSQAPNLTLWPVSPTDIRWRQHFRVNESARALENRAGGVETNTQGAVQVEMVGTCDSRSAVRSIPGAIYWPEAPSWALKAVADFLRWMNADWSLKLQSGLPWLAYGPDPRRPGISPASYGQSPARLSGSAWQSFEGVLGHQHVPENDHGDPGAFPIDTVLNMARGVILPPAPTPTPITQPTNTIARKGQTVAYVTTKYGPDPRSTADDGLVFVDNDGDAHPLTTTEEVHVASRYAQVEAAANGQLNQRERDVLAAIRRRPPVK